MAAFVSNTTIVHGDRPKCETYKRLNGLTTLADLDKAIAAQVRSIRSLGSAAQCIFNVRQLVEPVPTYAHFGDMVT